MRVLPCALLLAALALRGVQAGELLLERRRERNRRYRGTRVERLVYRSGDCAVTGYMARPENASGDLPVLLYCRGGFSTRLRSRLGYLANLARRGPYLVLASQYRGHDGGDCFDELGGRDVDDVMNLARAAREIEGADPGELHLYGVSRGGAMALLALARGLSARSAAVIGAPTDVAEMYRHLGPMRRRQLRRTLGGTPEEVPEAYRWRSPLLQAARIRTPVLLMHGTRDPLVPAGEASRLAEALARGGLEHHLELFPGAGHLLGGRRAVRRDELILDWFRRHAD